MSTPKMTEHTSIASLPLMVKIFAVLIGAVFALTMTGDIDKEGRLKISFGVLVKTTFSATLGFLGGEFIIEYFGLQDWTFTAHGLLMMMVSVFGMLIVGIIYQSLKLTAERKTLSELITEVKEAFKAMFK